MTVAELIEALRRHDGSLLVFVETDAGNLLDVEGVKVLFVQAGDEPEDNGGVILTLSAG